MTSIRTNMTITEFLCIIQREALDKDKEIEELKRTIANNYTNWERLIEDYNKVVYELKELKASIGSKDT